MKNTPQIKINLPESVSVELPPEVVIGIVSEYIRERPNCELPIDKDQLILSHAAAVQIVREHLADYINPKSPTVRETPSDSCQPESKPRRKSRNNPKPRK